jgi:hypothetical protein
LSQAGYRPLKQGPQPNFAFHVAHFQAATCADVGIVSHCFGYDELAFAGEGDSFHDLPVKVRRMVSHFAEFGTVVDLVRVCAYHLTRY